MPNHKSPGRAAFDEQLAKITDHIPPTYTGMVLVKLRKRGSLTRSNDKPITTTHIHNVRKGLVVDFTVLDALRDVAAEAGTLQPDKQ